MPLVVDTNILISGLLRDGATRSVLLDPGRRLLVPAYALDEVDRHVPSLAQRMDAEEKRVRSILDHLTDEVEVAALGTYGDRLPAAREPWPKSIPTTRPSSRWPWPATVGCGRTTRPSRSRTPPPSSPRATCSLGIDSVPAFVGPCRASLGLPRPDHML